MKTINLFIALLWMSLAFSQNYKADLKANAKNGLHRILLPPDFRAFADDDFDGVRIHDSQNNIVPYVIIRNTDKLFSEFNTLKLVSKQNLKDSITSIVIDTELNRLNHLVLRIGNTKINKYYNIYGSDNGNDWYGILENQRLNYLVTKDNTFVEEKIELPLNNYQFLKIDINNKTSSPINVIEVGTLTNKFSTSKPIELTRFIETTYSQKQPYITSTNFKADKPYKVDLIDFNINTEYFKREATLYANLKNDNGELYKRNITTLHLNSKNNNTFSTASLKASNFSVEINNNDDAALDFKAIKLYQNPIYVVANLKATETYSISIDSTLKQPNYDLKYYISNKTKVITEAKITNLKTVKNTIVTKTETSFWQTTIFMWLCIGIGGLIAAYFAIKLIKDI